MEPREHVLCVYGDNFIQSVKYKLTFLPLNDFCTAHVKKIVEVEPELNEKKTEMATFQREYMDLKKRWEAAKQRLKEEDEFVTRRLKERDDTYEGEKTLSIAYYLCLLDLFEAAAAPYKPISVPNSKSSSGFFSSIFGNKS